MDFNQYLSEIKAIRTAVFIKEQNVPAELEWDEFDADSIHILAYYDNRPVATARLLADGHIGRMAVLKEFRNRAVGTNMINYMIDLARTRSIKKIQLAAQEHAVEFYKKLGFIVISDVYLDAAIPHYDMAYD